MPGTRPKHRTATLIIFVLLALILLLLGIAARSERVAPHHCSAFTASYGETVLFASNQDDTSLDTAIDPVIWFYPASPAGFGYVQFGAMWQVYGTTRRRWATGINERGLAYATTGLPVIPLAFHSGPIPWSSFHTRAMRECADVSCVIKLANLVNWGNDSSTLHQQLFADSTGHAVALSAGKDGELVFTRMANDSYLAITNFNLANPENSVAPLPCARYETIAAMLTDVDPQVAVTVAQFRSILETIRAVGLYANTSYSHVFDLGSGDVFIYYFHQFGEGVHFNVSQELTKGQRIVKLTELMPQSVRDRAKSESRLYFALQPYTELIHWVIRVLLILDVLCIMAGVAWGIARLRRRRKEKVPSDDMPGQSELVYGILYLLVAVAWTWTFLIISMLHSLGFFDSNIALTKPPLPETLSITLAGLGPPIAAFALAWLTRGKEEIVTLVKQGVNLRFDKVWWVLSLLTCPVVFSLAYLIAGLRQPAPALERLHTVPYLIFLGLTIAGEFGWRGYGLSRLQSRLSALVSSLVVGLAWSLWHLPLFFTVGAPQSLWSFPHFAILGILTSVLFTWIYNNVGGSIIAAFVLQAAFTFMVFWGGFGGLLRTDWGSVSVITVTATAVVLVTLYWGPSQLVREVKKK